MARDRVSKLAEIFERIGYAEQANQMRRNCGIPVMAGGRDPGDDNHVIDDQGNRNPRCQATNWGRGRSGRCGAAAQNGSVYCGQHQRKQGTRSAQVDETDPRGGMTYPADFGSKRNILEGPRATKMHERHQALPPFLQRWVEVMQKKGPVQQIAPVPASAYGVDPEYGGQPGYPGPGGNVIGLSLGKDEQGQYLPPGEGVPEIRRPGGEVTVGWGSDDERDAFVDQYNQRLEEFQDQTTAASQKFNDVNRDWLEEEAGRPSVARLLSQNFWSTFDRAIYGGSRGIQPIDTGDGRNMMAAIDHRLNAIADIRAGVDLRRLAQGDEMRGVILSQQADALASLSGTLWDSNPEAYLRNLSLLYSGDVDLMRINPLQVQYPNDLLKMFDAYVETGTAAANIPEDMRQWIEKNTKPERTVQGVDPRDMLRQKWPLIDVSPDAMKRAALMRKQIRDTSHFYGFTSPKTNFEVPMPEAQLHHIDDYAEEVDLLNDLRESLLRAVDLKLGAGMENNSWEQVSSKPGLVKGMDDAMSQVLTLAGQLYGSDRFVTKDDRLNAAYDVGQATKMEIFMKALYLAQGWKAFLAHRMPELVERQGINPEEIGLGTLAQIVAGFVRLASMADEIGAHRLADRIDASLL